MLPQIHDYDRLCAQFRWPKLARYNIGIDVCDPQALPSGIGLCEALGEERAGRFQPVQLERLCGTLITHPT